MLRFKIFTARAQSNVNEIYDKLADDVAQFIFRLPQFSNSKIEWHQTQHGEYDVRLTAIVSYIDDNMDAYT